MPLDAPGRGAAASPTPTKRRPTLCLVTDRRRLLAALGMPANRWREALLDQVAGAVAGGIDVVQLRERDLDHGVLAAVTRDCLVAARGTQARILVNDRADVAVACGAHGVHLREDGIPPAAARRLAGPPFVVGRSVHDADSAAASAPADYLIAGPVFETVSKGGHPGLGILGFRAIARAAACPVWAIGGVTPLHVSALEAVGADGLGGIGAFIPHRPTADISTSVQELVKKFRIAFDSPPHLP